MYFDLRRDNFSPEVCVFNHLTLLYQQSKMYMYKILRTGVMYERLSV